MFTLGGGELPTLWSGSLFNIFVSVAFELSRPIGLDDPCAPSSDAHDSTAFQGKKTIFCSACGSNYSF